MNDILKMYGSIGSEIMNRYFVVAMCFKSQPRWRRLQTINTAIVLNKFDIMVMKICDTVTIQASPRKISTYRIGHNTVVTVLLLY